MKTRKIFRVRTLLLSLLILVFILLGATAGVLLAMKTAGRADFDSLREEHTVSINSPDGDSYEDGLLDESSLRYNGKIYRYNDSLSSMLVVGVDREELGSTEGVLASGGQADAIYLFVLDESSKRVSIIPIDRNTMTEIENFDASGDSIGFSRTHIAYSYAYGDGKDESCKLVCQAVSDLLYGVPIHAYFSISLSAIPDINDAVGGVTVSLTEDMKHIGERFVKGARVTLLGEEATLFLRSRMSVGDGSNTSRIERQKRYVQAFISSATSAFFRDLSLPLKILGQISKKSYTNLNANMVVYLASVAGDFNFVFKSIPGSTNYDSAFPEFFPDSDALFEMVLDVFYICENE